VTLVAGEGGFYVNLVAACKLSTWSWSRRLQGFLRSLHVELVAQTYIYL
jgi:hypothetical protein